MVFPTTAPGVDEDAEGNRIWERTVGGDAGACCDNNRDVEKYARGVRAMEVVVATEERGRRGAEHDVQGALAEAAARKAARRVGWRIMVCVWLRLRLSMITRQCRMIS